MPASAEIELQVPKVLIVEDEAIIAHDIRTQLEASGLIVTGIAASAADAFFQISWTLPDLVLMDISIKGEIDGVEAATAIRARHALPVIYLTAHCDDATLQRAKLTEPCGFIVKPLIAANLKAMITMAIYKHQRESQLQNGRALLLKIVQGLPDAVIAADLSGEILFLNHAGESLTGWSLQQATGEELQSIARITDGTHRPLLPELLRRAAAEGEPVCLPEGSELTTMHGNRVEVSGQVAIRATVGGADAVYVTLQDRSAKR